LASFGSFGAAETTAEPTSRATSESAAAMRDIFIMGIETPGKRK
jgi:hypothetical protein